MTLKKAGYITLGCKLNFSETSTIARQMEDSGVVRAARGEKADIYIINTCSVTEHADKKCRSAIRKAVRENPGAVVAVTGCYAQLRPGDIAAIEGVDIVAGNRDKGELSRRIMELAGKGKVKVYSCEAGDLVTFFASFSSGDRTRAFLKVQDGCDYKCSYCTIPYARGASRNIPVVEVVENAHRIASSGQKEIVLTGINTGDFGKTTSETFLYLLGELNKVDGIERYRISSIEPNLITDEIIEFTANSGRFMPHFHVPLQSGSDRILALMRRRYTTAKFEERIGAVRRAMPEAFIGIDVITGFPGETEEDFRETCRFLERIAPSFIHVFPYSVRPGTPAAEFDGKVSPREAAARVAELTSLSERLHRAFCENFAGQRAKVLFESTKKGGLMVGYTENYIKIEAPYRREAVNNITEVCIGQISDSGNMTADMNI